MIVRRKYYQPPPKEGGDFNHVFQTAAGAGLGRPVDKPCMPDGQWTPELLADAITSIDANNQGVDLRTVQNWFQDNDRGASAQNLRWLARVFGCGDPNATSEWQKALSLASRQSNEKRKAKRKAKSQLVPPDATPSPVLPPKPTPSAKLPKDVEPKTDLAAKTEVILTSQSALFLPLLVFAGACTLALVSFMLNVHDVIFTPENGTAKQVGFLWAPNWTFNLLIILPIFLAQLSTLLRAWKLEWRPRMEAKYPKTQHEPLPWTTRLSAASYSFWATMFVMVLIASLLNWIMTHLLPLLSADVGAWPVDWGRIAILQPELISIPAAIGFSGMVFLYNGATAYIFFSGHIFLHLLKFDFMDQLKALNENPSRPPDPEIAAIGCGLIVGIYRCTALGIAITLLMKLQSGFLNSDSVNILQWLMQDAQAALGMGATATGDKMAESAAPGVVFSFFSLIAIAGTFFLATYPIRQAIDKELDEGAKADIRQTWRTMLMGMALLVSSYFAIGTLPGFSLFTLFSIVFVGVSMLRVAPHPIGTHRPSEI